MTTPDSRQSPAQPTRLEVYVILATVATGAVLMYGAMQLPAVSRGNLSTGPGPGLFPIVTASLLVALSIWHVAVVLRRGAWKNREARVAPTVGYIVLIFVVGIVLLEILGFFLDMSLMVAALMLLFGERTRWIVAGGSVIAALVATLVFGEVFSVRLPTIGIPLGPWTL